MLEGIKRHDDIGLFVCFGPENATLRYTLPLRCQLGLYEQSFAQVEANDRLGSMLRDVNRLLSLTASEINDNLTDQSSQIPEPNRTSILLRSL